MCKHRYEPVHSVEMQCHQEGGNPTATTAAFQDSEQGFHYRPPCPALWEASPLCHLSQDGAHSQLCAVFFCSASAAKTKLMAPEIVEVQMMMAALLCMSQAFTTNNGRTRCATHVGHRHLKV